MKVVFDIETPLWFDQLPPAPRETQIAMMPFGLAVARLIDDDGNEVERRYGKGQAGSVTDLWGDLLGADQIITFNGLKFDIPITYIAAAMASGIRRRWITGHQIDLFDSAYRATGRYYSLQQIASATLGHSKSADGRTAAQWLQSDDPGLLQQCADYCAQDVKLTHRLYEHACVDGLPLILPLVEKHKDPRSFALYLSERGDPVRLEWT
jgi:hypothetical protein